MRILLTVVALPRLAYTLGPLAVAVLGVAMGAWVDAAPKFRAPGPAFGPRPASRLAQNEDCIRCHTEHASEWEGSLHQQAWTDPMFQAAFEVEPMPFCQGCHAPETSPRNSVNKKVAHAGVTCVSCHLVEGEILAGPGAGITPHPVRREEGFSTEQACARCHEFDFPSVRGQAMQSTMSEHARSRKHDKTCADCHMPELDGAEGSHHDHSFRVVSDPEMLRSAVIVEASRTGDGIEIELQPGAVGHAFPTGDLFRRLVVRARPVGQADWSERFLSRHFQKGLRHGKVVRIQSGDDRVGVTRDPSLVNFTVDDTTAALEWEVAYQRVQHVPRGREHLAKVVDETLLDSGTLPSPSLQQDESSQP